MARPFEQPGDQALDARVESEERGNHVKRLGRALIIMLTTGMLVMGWVHDLGGVRTAVSERIIDNVTSDLPGQERN